jgi:arylsulfatase B
MLFAVAMTSTDVVVSAIHVRKWPNIDALVADGIELDRFYVAPMCSPTRAGLMTGRYPIRFGLARAVIPPYRNFGLAVEERTIANALADAGYKHRGVFGKWHLGHHQAKWHPLARGFTQFEGHYNGAIDYITHERDGERDWHIDYEPVDKPGYSTDLIADAAAGFVRSKADEDSPYFCYVAFNSPHSPFQAKPKDLARYVKRGSKPTAELTLRAMIWSLDQGVGRILRAIEESGEAANTQVWFFSDNGGIGKIKANNRPLRGNKLSTFEGGIRVPACARWPAAWQGGRVLENTIGYIDVFPTVLDSIGVDPAAGQPDGRKLDGVSLHELFSGRNTEFDERDWYSYHGQPGPQQEKIAIKTSDWKLVVEGPDLRRNGLTPGHQVYLFRMPDDLFEKNDQSQQQPRVVEGLIQKLTAHRSLQPDAAVPPYHHGKKGFKPPKNWRVDP